MGAAIFGGASLGALAVTISATEADNKSGQDWILEKVFGGNEGEYTTTVMILDLLSMGYVQIGMDNISLAKNRKQKEANIEEKSSPINEEPNSDLPNIQIYRSVGAKAKNDTILDAAKRCKDEEIIEIVKNIV